VTLLYGDQCFQTGNNCQRDTGSMCEEQQFPFGGPAAEPGDGGAPVSPMGRCVRGCGSDAECDPMTQATHVPHLCDAVDATCVPAVPFVAHCRSDASCIGDLKCIAAIGGCTRTCATESDCTNDPALGSAFTCQGICVPKKPSGEMAPATQCLSGRSDPMTGNCVSPPGWSCSDGAQCASHFCVPNGRDSPDGRCE
jgi:hypothetical protein